MNAKQREVFNCLVEMINDYEITEHIVVEKEGIKKSSTLGLFGWTKNIDIIDKYNLGYKNQFNEFIIPIITIANCKSNIEYVKKEIENQLCQEKLRKNASPLSVRLVSSKYFHKFLKMIEINSAKVDFTYMQKNNEFSTCCFVGRRQLGIKFKELVKLA